MHQGSSYFLAVDAKTGKNLWKKDRNLEPKDEAQDSYSSPIFLRGQGGTQLVVAGAECVNAYDPASGDQICIAWRRNSFCFTRSLLRASRAEFLLSKERQPSPC